MGKYFLRYILALLSIFLLSINNLYSQSRLSFGLSSGVSYYSFSKLGNSYNESTDIHTKIKNNLYFTPLLNIEYTPVVNHTFALSIEYMNLQPILQLSYDFYPYMEIPDVKFKITGLPLSLIYIYRWSDYVISPVIGVGISYTNADILVEKLFTGRSHDKNKISTNFYSGNVLTGIEYNLNNNWQMTSTIIYKHSSNYEYDNFYKIDLSGLNFFLGITYNP